MSVFKMAYVIDTLGDRDLIPEDVMNEIRAMWTDNAYGNDYYYIDMAWDMNEYRESSPEEQQNDFTYPKLMAWLDASFPVIDEKTPVLIRYWW